MEDLLFNPYAETLHLMTFLGLGMEQATKDYLKHVKNFKDVIDKWKSRIAIKDILEIQDHCKVSMAFWGYEPLHSVHDHKIFHQTHL